ncbi:C39 family peptidase [Akkermansia muciniphila]|nr:C39 family peptidase [Akkermansia muciniphila]
MLDSLANSRDFRNLLKAYNRAASKLKKEKVENEHDWSGFWDNADGEVLKLARAGSPSQVDRWLNAIKPYIMAGIPVFWSVQLGIVPEPLRLSQTRGGHLRLITGFDEEKKTLIFSDSWGPPIRRRKCRWQMPSPLRRDGRSCSLPNNRCGISLLLCRKIRNILSVVKQFCWHGQGAVLYLRHDEQNIGETCPGQ